MQGQLKEFPNPLQPVSFSLNCSCNLKKFLVRLYFFRALLVSQQDWGKGTEICHKPPVPTRELQPIFNIVLHIYYVYTKDKPASCCTWLTVVGTVRPSLSDAQRRNLDFIFDSFPLLLMDSQISMRLLDHLISSPSFSCLLLTISEECTISHLIRLFLNHFRACCRPDALTPKYSVYLPKHGHNPQIRKSTLIQHYLQNPRCHSKFSNCPTVSFFPFWSRIQFRITHAFSCHVSLVYFSLEHFLNISLSVMALTFFFSCKMSLNFGASSSCSCADWMHCCQEYHRHDVLFLSHWWHLNLNTLLSSCLLGFSIIKPSPFLL